MKQKIIFFVLCLFTAMPQILKADVVESEIQLLELFHAEIIGGDNPLDDSNQTPNDPTHPNDFHAYISGRTLMVTSDAQPVTRVIIVNRANNQTIVNRQFTIIDTELLSAGSYSIELQCDNLTLIGQFEAE